MEKTFNLQPVDCMKTGPLIDQRLLPNRWSARSTIDYVGWRRHQRYGRARRARHPPPPPRWPGWLSSQAAGPAALLRDLQQAAPCCASPGPA